MDGEMVVMSSWWWRRWWRWWWWWWWMTLVLHDSSRGGSALPHRPPTTLATPTHCRGCPYFLATPSHVTTPIGQAVNLTCGVRMLGDRQVSWIRRRDLHVLTTDSFTYTSDPRFSALHQATSPYWVLHVTRPTLSDAGVYECQVSAQPKIFRPFTLEVVEPRAVIVGGQEVFMRAGSDLNITCLIKGATSEATPVTWLRVPLGSSRSSSTTTNNRKRVEEVNSGGRGGVQLVTDRRAGTSRLLVTRATWRDGGIYTCSPARARPASVVVHVLDEETPAAMQPPLDHGHAPEAPSSSSSSSSSSASSSSSSSSSSSLSSSSSSSTSSTPCSSSWWWPALALALVLQSSVLWVIPAGPREPHL